MVATIFLFMNSSIFFSSDNLDLRHKGNYGVIWKVELGESLQQSIRDLCGRDDLQLDVLTGASPARM